MKKYFLALLVGVSLMSMQVASAATLTLGTVTSNTSIDTAGPAASVAGTSSGSVIPGLAFAYSAWSLVVDADTAVDFNFVGANVGGVIGSTSSAFTSSISNATTDLFLTAGSYVFAVLSAPADAVFTVNVSISDDNGGGNNNVPLPASVWLFGSALMGLFGASRRKSKAGFAA